MGTRFRIVFKETKPSERWAAHCGKDLKGDIEIPGNWRPADDMIGGPFHFEQILLDPSLLNLLSTDDRIRFIAAQTVYNNVIHGRGYFGDREETT